MVTGSSIVNGLITGGLGATIGSVFTAVIQIMSKKGESRATAADIVTGASERIIVRLENENRSMRHAIVLLTEVNDEIVSELRELGAQDGVISKLKQANRAAKMALSPGAEK